MVGAVGMQKTLIERIKVTSLYSLLSGLCLLFITGCSVSVSREAEPPEKYTKIHYSSYFTLTIPTLMLADAKILDSDGTVIVFDKKRQLSGFVITNEKDNLPEKFNLGDYPKYLLELKETDGLPADIKFKFELSSKELKQSLGGPVVSIYDESNKVYYVVCKEKSCVTFVIMKGQSEQIFMLTSEGFDWVFLKNFIDGN